MKNEDIDSLIEFLKQLFIAYSVQVNEKSGNFYAEQKMFLNFERTESKLIFYLPIPQDQYATVLTHLFRGDWKTIEFFKEQADLLRKVADVFEHEEISSRKESKVTSILVKHLNFDGHEGNALILRILANYIENSCKFNLEYLNRFLDKADVRDKFSLSRSEGNGRFYFRFEANTFLFLEHFIYFIIKEYSHDCRWIKVNGQFGKIYKHHLIVFNNWIAFEQDALKQINMRIVSNENFENLIVIEKSEEAGVDSTIVFKRALARYTFKKSQPYLLYRNNCEHFGRYCFLGSPGSVQIKRLLVIMLSAKVIIEVIKPLNPFNIVTCLDYAFYILLAVLIFLEFIIYCIWLYKNDKTEFRHCFGLYLKSIGSFPK